MKKIEGVPDPATIDASGENLCSLPAGVKTRPLVPHIDERGMLFEIFDARWNWHAAPLVYNYLFTLRPGVIKGWAMHKKHDDRYCILFGEVLLVLFDDRVGSSTRGAVSKIALSEFRRQLINIPAGVWHATQNIGGKDAALLNFPTAPYQHDAPDKFTLPFDTNKIPYRFAARV